MEATKAQTDLQDLDTSVQKSTTDCMIMKRLGHSKTYRFTVGFVMAITWLICTLPFVSQVTDHHESDWMSVSVMIQNIMNPTECLSVWCYSSSSIWLNVCQCDITDHYQSDWMSVSVMLQIVIDLIECLSVWCYRSSSVCLNVCQCDVTDHYQSDWIFASVILQIIISLTECLSV